MTRRFLSTLCVAVCAGLSSLPSLAAPERVGDFALLDEEGVFHQLSRYQHREAVVLLAYDSSCPAARDAAASLASLCPRREARLSRAGG